MNQKPFSISDLFLAFLAIMLISVSFLQTWDGLKQIFGPASFVISMVLSLLLLFLCWMLRNAKLTGKPTAGLVGIYLFIASFCFIANFNALYTRFMKTDIYTTELREINVKFNQLESNVKSKFNYKYNKETTQNIDIIKKQLIEQIKDPGNKGIGERAQNLIKDLEKLLGQKIDLLTPVGNDYVDLSARMGSQIDNMISNLSPDESALNTEMAQASAKWNKKIQEVLVLPNTEKDQVAQGLIDESVNEYNKIGNKAELLLGKDKFKFESKVSNTQEVGKIGFAFEHAIKNFGIFQFVVLMGCILLDFVIVIIILLVTDNDVNSNKGSVFKNKRNSNTLIPNA